MNDFTNRGFDNTTSSDSSSGNYTGYQENVVKITLPNSGAILSLGILSIVSLCCCGPALGPILAVIALAMVPSTNRKLKTNPDYYYENSINNFKIGKVLSIIGLCIGIVFLIYIVILLIGDVFNFEYHFYEKTYEFWNELNY